MPALAWAERLVNLSDAPLTAIVSQPVSKMWAFSYHGDTKAQKSSQFLKDSDRECWFAEECIK
jgi:hypothetical protein